MSSDGYFDGEDDIDSEALAEIDAIEAAHALPSKQTIQPLTSTDPKRRPPLPAKDDSFNVDESDLNKLDEFTKGAHPNSAAPVGQRKFTRTPSSNMVQTTLFGAVVGQQSSSTNKLDLKYRGQPPLNGILLVNKHAKQRNGTRQRSRKLAPNK